MYDILDQFRQAMLAVELIPPHQIIADGAIHRCGTKNKSNDHAGWYALHLDGVPAGIVGNWRTGVRQTWHANVGRPLTQKEKREFQRKVEQITLERARERALRHAEAASIARKYWALSQPASQEHLYLVKKQVQPHNIRQNADVLLVPLRDANGNLFNVQYIFRNGKKLFLKDGKKRGLFHFIGEPGACIVVAEGFATAASVHEATGLPVAIAFDAGNLEPVVLALKSRLPDTMFLFAADNDASSPINIGLTKAEEAARRVGGKVIVPSFNDPSASSTDMNDLHVLEGIDAVRKLFAEVLP